MGLGLHNDGFWDDLRFEQAREDDRVPEWHPWDEKVFEDPAGEERVDADV